MKVPKAAVFILEKVLQLLSSEWILCVTFYRIDNHARDIGF